MPDTTPVTIHIDNLTITTAGEARPAQVARAFETLLDEIQAKRAKATAPAPTTTVRLDSLKPGQQFMWPGYPHKYTVLDHPATSAEGMVMYMQADYWVHEALGASLVHPVPPA